MLVSAKEILTDAHQKNYAVCALNTANLEFTKAIVEAAETLASPVIIQTSQEAIQYAGGYELWAIVTTIANRAKVPVALHLDHGTDFNMVMGALRTGWTSIMFDTTRFTYEENVAMTKMIMQIAKPMDVQVEAELRGENQSMTDPEEALDFVTRTEADSLAIWATSKENPKPNFDRIEQIKKKIDRPLVLCNDTELSEEEIKKVVERGINKMQIDQELRLAFKKGMQDALKEGSANIEIKTLFTPGMDQIKEIVKSKIKLFGSEGRA